MTNLLPGEDRCGHAHCLTAQEHLRATHVVHLTRWSDDDRSCRHTDRQSGRQTVWRRRAEAPIAQVKRFELDGGRRSYGSSSASEIKIKDHFHQVQLQERFQKQDEAGRRILRDLGGIPFAVSGERNALFAQG